TSRRLPADPCAILRFRSAPGPVEPGARSVGQAHDRHRIPTPSAVSPEGTAMIEVDRLTKFYGPVAAIRDVSFTVPKGALVGFLGPNGAGKPTTMRILSCFMPASSGSARVARFDVFEQSIEVRRRIGYLPENVPLYVDMTVSAYLDFVGDVKGLGRVDRRRRVAEGLERCLIADVRDRLIGRVSQG